MANPKIVRRVRSMGITFSEALDEYLVSIHWKSLDDSSNRWTEQSHFFTFDADDLEKFSADFLATDAKMRRLIAKQEAKRASRRV